MPWISKDKLNTLVDRDSFWAEYSQPRLRIQMGEPAGTMYIKQTDWVYLICDHCKQEGRKHFLPLSRSMGTTLSNFSSESLCGPCASKAVDKGRWHGTAFGVSTYVNRQPTGA